MSSSHITYSLNNTPAQSEDAALASVYRFILDCHAKKKAARPDRPDDVEESENDHTAELKYKR